MNRIRISDVTMKQAGREVSLSFKEKIELAKLLDKLGVAVIDLTRASEELVDAMGPAAQTTYYMNLPAGVYPHFPNGQKDNTHLQPAGAVAFGALIARGLYELGGEYKDLLCDDFEQYLRESGHFGMETTAADEVEK